jgi:multimeric flavodoxin WrbA
MNVIVITSSPNADGLTAACANAALEGLQDGGAEVELVNLNKLKVGMCQACDDGWGTCRNEHECQVLDDFQALHKRAYEADALVLVTPVCWHDRSDSQGRIAKIPEVSRFQADIMEGA